MKWFAQGYSQSVRPQGWNTHIYSNFLSSMKRQEISENMLSLTIQILNVAIRLVIYKAEALD